MQSYLLRVEQYFQFNLYILYLYSGQDYAFIIYSLFRILAFFLCLISISLTWYQSWFYGTKLNPKYSFCKIRYFNSFCNYFGILTVFAIILVFHLPFSFCNLVFAFSFCKFVLCFGSNRIISRRYFFSFCNLVFCLPLLLHSGYL